MRGVAGELFFRIIHYRAESRELVAHTPRWESFSTGFFPTGPSLESSSLTPLAGRALALALGPGPWFLGSANSVLVLGLGLTVD